MPKQFYVVGPTCTGKTELTVRLAERFGGEIISCDSVQVYAGLEIGAAKPDASQLARVRHHLVSHIPFGATLTAGEFRRQAQKIIDVQTGPVWLVGGSGFYISALQNGMFELEKVPDTIRETLRVRLEAEGLSVLYKELSECDPTYAQKISANDTYRVMRGLEIWQHHKKPLSQIQAEFRAQTPVVPMLKMGLRVERSILRDRVRARTQQMLREGLVEETRGLLDQGLADWPPLASVGYNEACAFIQGELTPSELEERIVTSTMQLAKRQMTWFQRDKEILWFDTGKGLDQAYREMEKAVSSWLNSNKFV